MKLCDLHTHSCYSDGSHTPEELVRLAAERGLSALALTDHNTAKGLPEFMRAAADSTVTAVPGCEFSTEYAGREVHIVGLFMPERSWTEIEDFVELMRMAKENSNRRMIDALRADGYAVTFAEAAALTGGDTFNRAHVARVLLGKGYVGSVQEAFRTLLREGGKYYTPAKKLASLAAIRFIKDYGGAAVLAHPFLNFDAPQLAEFLPQAKDAGLDAIETRYSLFDAQETREAEKTAETYGLLQSGGSDYHGAAKPDIELGSGHGSLAVPLDFYESIKMRTQNRGGKR